MNEEASIIHDCYIPPKRLIHLFIFMLISLTCFHMEDPIKKICWTTLKHHRYHPTKSTRILTLPQCKAYCEFKLPCRLIVFDGSSAKCSYNEFEHSKIKLLHGSNINYSSFKSESNVHTYILDLACNRNGTSCWTVKGDYSFKDLLLISKPKMTLPTCMYICVHEYPDCDIINFLEMPFGKTGCYVKTQTGPLNKFNPMSGITSYILNRTCHALLPSTDSTPPIITTEVSESNGKSFFDKYYLYIMAAGGGLLFLICASLAVKLFKAPSSAFSSEEL